MSANTKNPLVRIGKIDPDRVAVQLKVRNIMLFAGFLMGVIMYFILTLMLEWSAVDAALPAIVFGLFMMGMEYFLWRLMTESVAKKLERGSFEN